MEKTGFSWGRAIRGMACAILLSLFCSMVIFPPVEVSAAGINYEQRYYDSNGIFIGGGHYYDQLNDVQKDTYRLLLKEACQFGNHFYVNCGTWSNLWAAWHAMYVDHGEELWWLEHDLDSDDDGVILSYFIQPSEWASAQQRIDAKVNSIIAGMPSGASDYTKLKYAYDWLINNVDYDYDGVDGKKPLCQSLYSTFLYGKTVCTGYARGLNYILDKCGIDTVWISGFTNGGRKPTDDGFHAWSLVRLGNDWYYCDPTWGWGDGTGPVDYRFLACTEAVMNDLHRDGMADPHFWTGYCEISSNLPAAVATNPTASASRTPVYRVSGTFENGSISGTGSHNKGSNVAVTYRPNNGYVRRTMFVNGEAVMSYFDDYPGKLPSGFTISGIKHNYDIKIDSRQMPALRVEGKVYSGADWVDTITIRPAQTLQVRMLLYETNVSTWGTNGKFNFQVPSGFALSSAKRAYAGRYGITSDNKVTVSGRAVSASHYSSTDSSNFFASNPFGVTATMTHDGQTLGRITCTGSGSVLEGATASGSVSVTVEGWKVGLSAAHGSLTGNGTGIKQGESRTFTYKPDDGYYVKALLLDGNIVPHNVRGGTYTVSNIRGDHTLAVQCEKLFKVATSVTDGTVTPSNDRLYPGDSFTFNYAPNDGYYVKSVLVDGKAIAHNMKGGSYTITNINENHTVVVQCLKLLKVVTSITHGTITPTDDRLYPGDSKKVTYSPDEGYYVKSVTINGTKYALRDVKPYLTGYTFTNIQADSSISVECALIPELSFTVQGKYLNSLGMMGSLHAYVKVSGNDYLGDPYTFYRHLDFTGGSASLSGKFPAGVYQVSVLAPWGVDVLPAGGVSVDTRDSDSGKADFTLSGGSGRYGYRHADADVSRLR